MIEFFSNNNISSEKAFIPSRAPPPTHPPDRSSDIPSYYGFTRHGSHEDLGNARDPVAPTNETNQTSEKSAVKTRRRRRKFLAGVLTAVVVIAVIVIAVAVTQRSHSHRGPEKTGGLGSSASDKTTSKKTSKSTSYKFPVQSPTILSRPTSATVDLTTSQFLTTTTLETQYQTAEATTVFITSTPSGSPLPASPAPHAATTITKIHKSVKPQRT